MNKIKRTGRFGLTLGVIIAAVAFAAIAHADDFVTDADAVTTGAQHTKSLSATTGETKTFSVDLWIQCTSKNNHMAASVTISYSAGSTVPSGGSLSATPVTFSRPAAWPADGTACPSDPLTTATQTTTVSITAPSIPGTYSYVLRFSSTDSDVTTNSSDSRVAITLTVTPPPDTTAPVITPTVTPSTPNGSNGWYSSGNVAVSWTVTDAESAVTSKSEACDTTTTITTDGTHTVTCQAGSAGGTASESVTIKRDTAAPVVTCGTADGAWHNDNISVGCTSNDFTSGLANAVADGSFSLSTTIGPNSETSDAATGAHSVADLAGNSATAGPIVGNMVDRKAPTFSCASPDGAWHSTDVSLACTAADGGSGLALGSPASFSLSTNVAGDTEIANAVTGTQALADAVGNSSTAGPIGGNQVDKRKPSVVCTAPDSSNWHGDNVTVSCTANDAGSGLANAADASFSLTTSVAEGNEDDTASTAAKSVADAVGNTETVGPYTFKVDRKQPTVDCSPTSSSAWHSDNVTVNCTATDGGAGLADPVDANFALHTSIDDGEETNSAATDSNDVADAAGNSITAGPYTFQVDRKKPTVSCSPTTSTLWHGANVTVNCTANDAGSGLAEPGDASFALHTDVSEGVETDSAVTDSNVVADVAGHSDTAGPYTFKVDRKKPSVSCGSADDVWHAADISIHCTASDGGSGLADVSDASFDLTTDVADDSETDNGSTNSRVVADAVGNSDTAGPIGGNKVDKKSPSVTCNTAGIDFTAWYAENKSVACSAVDGGSGVAAADASFDLSTDVADGSEDAAAQTGSRAVADSVGNTAAAVGPYTFRVDRKKPVVACDAPDGLWHATDTLIHCTASDGGSGLADAADASFDLSTNVAAGTETANAATGSRVVIDAVGNSDTAGPISGNKVDKKGPAITCPAAPTFLLHQTPANVVGSFTDGGSGPEAGSTGTAADTSSVGAKQVTLSATDNVGNASSKPCGYSVGFKFLGFFAPINKPNVMNLSKAGQALPLKWQLLDANDQPFTTLTSASVRVTDTNCSLGATVDLIEEYAAGSSGLQNLGGGYYQFNWKSPTSYVNSCKSIGMDLGEGLVRTNLALVTFTK